MATYGCVLIGQDGKVMAIKDFFGSSSCGGTRVCCIWNVQHLTLSPQLRPSRRLIANRTMVVPCQEARALAGQMGDPHAPGCRNLRDDRPASPGGEADGGVKLGRGNVAIVNPTPSAEGGRASSLGAFDDPKRRSPLPSRKQIEAARRAAKMRAEIIELASDPEFVEARRELLETAALLERVISALGSRAQTDALYEGPSASGTRPRRPMRRSTSSRS